MFSIFCGFVVAMDYVLSLLIMYPSLCMYDSWLLNGYKGVWLKIGRGDDNNNVEADEECHDGNQKSCDERTLWFHYTIIHKLRWLLLLVTIGAIIACCFVVSQLRVPSPNTDPPIFLPSNNRYEMHRIWSQELLSSALSQRTIATFIFGAIPADTGNYWVPDDQSQLVLDPNFNPRDEATQEYILNFCESIYDTSSLVEPPDYECIMKGFDLWLQTNSQSANQTREYRENCAEASAIPVSPQVFDSCIIAYSEEKYDKPITHNGTVVQTLSIHGLLHQSSSFEEQGKELARLNAWSEDQRRTAPHDANKFFFASWEQWKRDTYDNARISAYTSALIAIVCAAIMILLTSQSILVAMYAAVSITYVFVASTACLVILGWKLGV